jgi:hypothetical protein
LLTDDQSCQALLKQADLIFSSANFEVTWQFEEYQKFQKMLQDWRISISMESVG